MEKLICALIVHVHVKYAVKLTVIGVLRILNVRTAKKSYANIVMMGIFTALSTAINVLMHYAPHAKRALVIVIKKNRGKLKE